MTSASVHSDKGGDRDHAMKLRLRQNETAHADLDGDSLVRA